ncbi:MAG: thioredoxin family protein [Phycisphaerales bacterium]|nr:thioredoxin family protein [Phycisphaerales bacterium]
MIKMTKSRAALFALGAAVTGSMLGAGSLEQAKPGEIGAKAPDFTLVDTDGKEHTLSEYTKQGKTVVLEWFSPECPFVKKHYREDTGTMLAIQDEMKDQPVVWLRINSGRKGHPSTGVERNKQAAADWGINTAILLDDTGKVGMSYNAKRTPEMYVIDAQGVLRYHGAIDNRNDAAMPGDVNYVRNALQQVLAGETVTTTQTKAYGCGVKY